MKVLVVSVGGTPEPIVEAVRHAAPERVVWVVSADSERTLEKVFEILKQAVPGAGAPGVSWQKTIRTPNPEDLTATFAAIHEGLAATLAEWRLGWEDVVVDLTAGTKPMSAALALASIHGARNFQYIGGGRRSKDGLGVVEGGSERVVSTHNPWDELAVDSLRQIAVAFNRFDFATARSVALQARGRVSRPELRVYLEALEKFIEAFEAWDLFEYKAAGQRLFASRDRLILHWSAHPSHRHLPDALARSIERIQCITASLRHEAPSRPLLEDLLANAMRRGRTGRFDDAVARLYRYLEGFAQAALWDSYNVKTGEVALEHLPDGDPMFDRAREQAVTLGAAQIGLRDAYHLLARKGHPAGAHAARMDQGESFAALIRARNQSLLAHGTEPVGESPYQKLLGECLSLAGTTGAAVFTFPELPVS